MEEFCVSLPAIQKKIRSVRGSLLRSSFFQVCNFIISSFNTVLSLDLFKGLIFQAANKLHQSISKKIQKFQTTYDSAGIEHFTVACLVTWPLK